MVIKSTLRDFLNWQSKPYGDVMFVCPEEIEFSLGDEAYTEPDKKCKSVVFKEDTICVCVKNDLNRSFFVGFLLQALDLHRVKNLLLKADGHAAGYCTAELENLWCMYFSPRKLGKHPTDVMKYVTESYRITGLRR